MENDAEIIIAGGGIVGLTLAKTLYENGHRSLCIVEKESTVAQHASGRNSGVIHAGIYYPEDTLKAKFCLEGNRKLIAYCEQNNIDALHTGKVIVSRSEEEISTLHELHRRASANGAKTELITPTKLAEFEPHAKTTQEALYSHYTAVVNPIAISEALVEELRSKPGVSFRMGTTIQGRIDENTLQTDQGPLRYQRFINAAGAFADKLAHPFGVGKKLSLIPFKGIYKKLKDDYKYLVNGNIYPVPDIRNPFLGVHFTKNYKGDVYVGPTAIPALGRENYGLLRGIDQEAFRFLMQDALLFCTNPKFRQVAITEPKKYIDKYFFEDAQKLVKELHPHWLTSSEKCGIRPQLVDWDTRELVMDFLVLKGPNSVHVLNAISPAFTCSFSFAQHIVENYI